MPLDGYTSPKDDAPKAKKRFKAMATTQKEEAKGSKDGGPANPEVQDDAPGNSKKSTKAAN